MFPTENLEWPDRNSQEPSHQEVPAPKDHIPPDQTTWQKLYTTNLLTFSFKMKTQTRGVSGKIHLIFTTFNISSDYCKSLLHSFHAQPFSHSLCHTHWVSLPPQTDLRMPSWDYLNPEQRNVVFLQSMFHVSNYSDVNQPSVHMKGLVIPQINKKVVRNDAGANNTNQKKKKKSLTVLKMSVASLYLDPICIM